MIQHDACPAFKVATNRRHADGPKSEAVSR